MKVVVVGDGAVGKTCLLLSFTANSFPGDYVPTVFDNFQANMCAPKGDKIITMNLWDTAGQEDYDKLRPLSYPQTDVFMVCYSTVDPTSLRNVKRKWLPELRTHNPDAQIVLVGTKIDLRSDERIVEKLHGLMEEPISWQAGEEFAREEKLAKYCECCALTQEGLKDAFCQVANVAMEERETGQRNRRRRRQRAMCSIM